MRNFVMIGFAASALFALAGCEFHAGTSAGANAPPPAPAPAPAPSPAPAPGTAAAPAPAPASGTPPKTVTVGGAPATTPPASGAPGATASSGGTPGSHGIAFGRARSTVNVGSINNNSGGGGTQVPVQTGDNGFGSGTQTSDSLTGVIYFIPQIDSLKKVDWSTLKPSGVLYTRTLDVSQRQFNQGFPGVDNRFEWFAIRYDATFNVAQGGTYAFELSSDDGSLLYIDDKLVVDNDGPHWVTPKTGEIALSQGQHKIHVDYYQGEKYHVALQLFVTPAGGAKKLFTTQL